MDSNPRSLAGSRLGGGALSLRGAIVNYGREAQIGPVDLELPRGSVLGLAGGNGAGKTTILRLICGLLAATCGEVRVLGSTVVAGRVPQGLGAMIEEPPVFPWATGRQHLELASAGRKSDMPLIQRLLVEVGLEGAEDQRVSSYSQGMRQRLGIARALLSDPDLLVLDEPTNGLDPHGVQWLRKLLRSRAREGRTVVVSSHMLSEMQLVADKVIMLAGGVVLSVTDISALPAQPGALEAHYFATLEERAAEEHRP